MSDNKHPCLGFGLGLRSPHYNTILTEQPAIDWFEILSENYMVPGGRPLYYLDQICERYPVVMHGVSMSIGSTDPLDWAYLKKLKTLADRTSAMWLSDHLCWTGIQGKNLHDLLPLPYTEEALQHVVSRVKQVQDYLGQPILLENPTSYIEFSVSSLSEWDFLREVALASGCLLLLDVNNVYVNSVNHGFDPVDYLNALPRDRIQQIHLAGHQRSTSMIIDTHDQPVVDAVWSLYDYALQRFGPVSTMIERDDHIPPLDELIIELDQARQIAERVLRENAA